ncbi:MAG: PP2C family protein-serine/threonine phosphatase [Acidobacteriaceae bacterium]|jgi:hypothetical protein
MARLAAGQAVVIPPVVLPQAAGPVAVDGPWTFSIGDSSAGSTASLSLPPKFAAVPQVLWLRATLQMSAPVPNPALLIAPRAMGCEIFINDLKAADCAQLSAPNDRVQRGLLVHLPEASPGVPFSAPIRLAIRLVRPATVEIREPLVGTIGLESDALFNARAATQGWGLRERDVLFGSAGALEDHRTAADATHFFNLLPQTLLCVAELVGGTILLLVFADDRRGREYFWFAVFLWLDGTCSFLSVFARVYPLLPPFGHNAGDIIGLIARYAPLIGFLAAFTGVRINRWVRAYQIALVLVPLLMIAQMEGVNLGWWPVWTGASAVFLWAQIPFVCGSLIFLAMRWRRGNKEAGLLLPSFVLANGIEILGLVTPYFHQRFHVGRFSYDFDDLSMFFFLVSIAPVIALRHRRITLEHARATAELGAAREIQQNLVPATLPQLDGLILDAVYRPATEVGGDFYQALERADGSLLLVVGDVSGKGLKAAMRGTLALGLVRAYAAEGFGPGALLARMNREIHRMGEEGFITCICAVVDQAGRVTIANAGHLSPYRNGHEVEIDAGLPLGILGDSQYAEAVMTLDAGDLLTLISDGIVEAQGPTGELFGFERTQAISTQPARSIADAAQQFGQEDDITVLTLAFSSSLVPAGHTA